MLPVRQTEGTNVLSDSECTELTESLSSVVWTVVFGHRDFW